MDGCFMNVRMIQASVLNNSNKEMVLINSKFIDHLLNCWTRASLHWIINPLIGSSAPNKTIMEKEMKDFSNQEKELQRISQLLGLKIIHT